MPMVAAGFGIQSKLEKQNTENRAKLATYGQFCLFMFTKCRTLGSSTVRCNSNQRRLHSKNEAQELKPPTVCKPMVARIGIQ